MTTPATTHTIGEYVDLAADYVATHGLARGQYEDRTGAVCAAGALRKVIGYYTNDDEMDCLARGLSARQILERAYMCGCAETAVANALRTNGFDGFPVQGDGGLMSWSDKEDQETVVRGLREAARVIRKLEEEDA